MLYVVRIYILLGFYFRKITSGRIRGLGFVQRLVKSDCVLTFRGKSIYYDHKIQNSYDLLLIGRSNEPETHIFFERLIPKLECVNFVDVGASIGEMVVGVIAYGNVKNIFAFEPRPLCAKALRRTLELNNEKRVKVYQNIVSNSNEEVLLYINPGATSSSLYDRGGSETVKVQSVSLDSVLPQEMSNTIILVDVEGAEPLVLESGANFIKKNRPLIIFEYNKTSKKYFNLEQIQSIIGDGYAFYRIKGDASLDKDFSNSWNVAAIPDNSEFHSILQELFCD